MRCDEQVGTYDPIPRHSDGFKEIRLKVDRIKYWLSVGAQPSDTVAKLLWRAGLAPPPPIPFTTQRHIKRSEREMHTATSGITSKQSTGRSFVSGTFAMRGAVPAMQSGLSVTMPRLAAVRLGAVAYVCSSSQLLSPSVLAGDLLLEAGLRQ